MKFLHVSDLHIGKRVNGISMLDDQRYILDQIVAIACDRGVDALVVAGDLYDKASPSAEAVTVFDAFLTELADRGVRVLAVPGNHDSAERVAYAQGLLAHQGVCFPPVYAGRIESVRIADEHGEVVFWLIPFLKPGDVRRFFPEAEIGDDYAAALGAVIGACDVDPAQRNVAVSHQLVTAGGVAVERADEEIKLGGIDNVDVSLYDDFDYVALGHVHRPQRVGRDTVRYSGSPLKYSFSEARYDKSVVLVEMGPKPAGPAVPGDSRAEGEDAGRGFEAGACVSVELVPLVPLHDMREVRMSLADLLALGEAQARAEAAGGGDAESAGDGAQLDGDGAACVPEDGAEAAGVPGSAEGADPPSAPGPLHDYLHVTLTDELPQLDAMAKVRALFPNAMALDYDNAAILAARSQALNAVDPDEIDTVELFARFYEEQVGRPMDDVQNALVAKVAGEVADSMARGGAGREGDAR